ncbi:hypothetical protein BRC79_09755 [Halobacteriales archaeon QH_8_67_27]|nr:MAG: hypothetical protein BRC79_09755 [Halobacteriales archaeon QH_8_67_27]
MSERTDERTSEDDVDDLLDDVSGDIDGTGGGDVGLDDGELGVDVDSLTSDLGGEEPSAEPSESKTDSGPGLRSRLTPSIGRPSLAPDVPSLRSFLLAFVAVIGGMVAGSAVPLVGSVTSILGVVAGAFFLGLLSGKRRYFPVAVAGAIAAVAASATLGALTFAFIESLGLVPSAAIGTTTGVIAAVVGHYFGRDLRAGLTRDV